ncbi:MAG: ATP-grasp domain-containing protein, partial [Ferrovum sp.]|nr:ATP-grasp domain-containing protein [Ferrovum sp.]
MKILVIGSGGREHALAWRLVQSQRVSHVFVAPGNAGMALEEGVHCVPLQGIEAWLEFAQTEQIAFTVVGPEAPIADGIVDHFRAAGLAIFGPSQAAAQLEISKDFAKQFMQRHNIPTARFTTFEDAVSAHAYLDQVGAPIVIKADGLAAGKGVVVAQTVAEAHQAVDHMMGGALGQAGHRVVIEEFLEGEEASFIVMADGEQVLPLATSQDHK